MKACVAERFIRTLKIRFLSNLQKKEHNWINILPDLIKHYNETVYSTIKIKPVEVIDNSLLSTVYNY